MINIVICKSKIVSLPVAPDDSESFIRARFDPHTIYPAILSGIVLFVIALNLSEVARPISRAYHDDD